MIRRPSSLRAATVRGIYDIWKNLGHILGHLKLAIHATSKEKQKLNKLTNMLLGYLLRNSLYLDPRELEIIARTPSVLTQSAIARHAAKARSGRRSPQEDLEQAAPPSTPVTAREDESYTEADMEDLLSQIQSPPLGFKELMGDLTRGIKAAMAEVQSQEHNLAQLIGNLAQAKLELAKQEEQLQTERSRTTTERTTRKGTENLLAGALAQSSQK